MPGKNYTKIQVSETGPLFYSIFRPHVVILNSYIFN